MIVPKDLGDLKKTLEIIKDFINTRVISLLIPSNELHLYKEIDKELSEKQISKFTFEPEEFTDKKNIFKLFDFVKQSLIYKERQNPERKFLTLNQ